MKVFIKSIFALVFLFSLSAFAEITVRDYHKQLTVQGDEEVDYTQSAVAFKTYTGRHGVYTYKDAEIVPLDQINNIAGEMKRNLNYNPKYKMIIYSMINPRTQEADKLVSTSYDDRYLSESTQTDDIVGTYK